MPNKSRVHFTQPGDLNNITHEADGDSRGKSVTLMRLTWSIRVLNQANVLKSTKTYTKWPILERHIDITVEFKG